MYMMFFDPILLLLISYFSLSSFVRVFIIFNFTLQIKYMVVFLIFSLVLFCLISYLFHLLFCQSFYDLWFYSSKQVYDFCYFNNNNNNNNNNGNYSGCNNNNNNNNNIIINNTTNSDYNQGRNWGGASRAPGPPSRHFYF